MSVSKDFGSTIGAYLSSDLPIVMPHRHRFALRPLQVGAAAAMLAVVAVGSVFGLGRSGGLTDSLSVTARGMISAPDAMMMLCPR